MQEGIYTCTIRKSGSLPNEGADYRLAATAATLRAHANLNAFVPPKGWPPQAESSYNKVDTVASRLGWNAAAKHGCSLYEKNSAILNTIGEKNEIYPSKIAVDLGCRTHSWLRNNDYPTNRNPRCRARNQRSVEQRAASIAIQERTIGRHRLRRHRRSKPQVASPATTDGNPRGKN